MSIPNLIHKIKGQGGIDKTSILFLCIIIGVGISSFCLGRYSIDLKSTEGTMFETDSKLVANDSLPDPLNENNEMKVPDQGERRYVASKNGKMYYSLNCAGANRINPENQIWFSTKEDAEKSGFTLSKTCK